MAGIGHVRHLNQLEQTGKTSFQAGFYQSSHEEDHLDSRYQPYPIKIAWNNTTEFRLESNQRQDGKYIFRVSDKCHFLRKVMMIARLPPLKIKKEHRKRFRFAYTFNPLHHIHGTGIFSIDESNSLQIDPYVLDVHRVSYINDVYDYDVDIGNKPELLDWSTEKSGDELSMFVPWSFSKHDSLAFPLFEKSIEKKKVEFIYRFNLEMKHLIRIQYYREGEKGEEGEWKDAPFLAKIFEDLPSIQPPEMWGIYGNISEEELKARQDLNKDYNEKYTLVYVNNYVIESHEDKTDQDTFNIPIKVSGAIMGISWMVQNRRALKYNNHSNYTTHEDIYRGGNPVEWSGIKYNTSYRTSPRSSIHFSRMYPKMYFGKAPVDPGYNFYFFDDRPRRIVTGNTIDPDNPKISPIVLEFSLNQQENEEQQSDIDTLLDNISNKNPDTYKAIVVIYSLKKLVWDRKKNQFYQISDEIMQQNILQD